jgi:hypothetical protein
VVPRLRIGGGREHRLERPSLRRIVIREIGPAITRQPTPLQTQIAQLPSNRSVELAMNCECQQPRYDGHDEFLPEECLDDGRDQQSDQDMPDNRRHQARWIYNYIEIVHGDPVDYHCSLVATIKAFLGRMPTPWAIPSVGHQPRHNQVSWILDCDAHSTRR